MLTPIEIEKKTFRKALRGYNADEVDNFMAEMKESYGRIYKEYLAAKDKITILTEAVRQYKSMEETLQNTLLIAQRAAEDVKKNADEKADIIIREAETKANEIISNASQDLTKVKYEYEELKRNVDVFRVRTISLLTSQLELIKDFSGSDDDVYSSKAKSADSRDFENNNAADEFTDNISNDNSEDGIDDIDIPQMLEKIERITMELPKIDIDENNDIYVPE